jgi:hypothetical protein
MRWKDYRHGNKQDPMTLKAEAFMRRFQLQVFQGVGAHPALSLPVQLPPRGRSRRLQRTVAWAGQAG